MYFLHLDYHKEYQFLWVSWKNIRFAVIQTIKLKQGVIGADAAAVVHALQTGEQDWPFLQIFQAKIQDVCARRDFWNTTLSWLENYRLLNINNKKIKN